MNYPVRCECGKVNQVSGGLAGSWIDCSCGRKLTIPELSTLRQMAPEGIISAMLSDNSLAEGEYCLGCNVRTDDIKEILVVYGRKGFVHKLSFGQLLLCILVLNMLFWYLIIYWLYLFAMVILPGLVVIAFLVQRSAQNLEQRAHFRLRVRLCESCSRTKEKSKLKTFLKRVPILADLMAKYPRADISVAT